MGIEAGPSGRAVVMVFLIAIASTDVASTEAGQQTIVFGGDASYPPFESLEKGVPAGFNIDLKNAVAEVGGATAVHRLGDWPEIMAALDSGEVDVVPMFRSIERESKYSFTSAIYYVHHSIYSKAGTIAVYSPEDLSGKRVAVEDLSYANQRLKKENPQAILVAVPSTIAALQAVSEGRAEYALLATVASDELIQKHKLPLQGMGSLIWPREYAFAVLKDRVELARWLRESLATVVTSGRYAMLFDKWEQRLTGQNQSLALRLRHVAVILVPLLLLMSLGLLWLWALRRTVVSRTAQLRRELQHRAAAEECYRYAANHDTQTGLPETQYFISLLAGHLDETDSGRAKEGEVSVFKLGDLDKLSYTFGNETTSALIEMFAARVKDAGFIAAGYLGRGVFATYADSKRTNEYFDSLVGPLFIRQLEIHPAIVGGSAYWPKDGGDAVELVKRAETAMAVAVARRHEWIAYEPSMEPDGTDLRIVAEFRKTKGNDLTAVLQPQFDLKSRAVVGAEALVRWNHAAMGFIPPARFIPLLESAGLVTKVTYRMIAEALRVASLLRGLGSSVPISVNVAAQDLIETDLLRVIERELQRYECAPGNLKLELTETSVAEDPERVRESLQQLSELGIRISVDDFGTGYSSLSYLSSFPIDELKIDREFVHGMTTSPKKQSIVRSTILMAKELGLMTVAEGAEDEATLEMLKDLGCDRVQGYALSRPLPEPDFLAFIEASSAGNVQ